MRLRAGREAHEGTIVESEVWERGIGVAVEERGVDGRCSELRVVFREECKREKKLGEPGEEGGEEAEEVGDVGEEELDVVFWGNGAGRVSESVIVGGVLVISERWLVILDGGLLGMRGQ